MNDICLEIGSKIKELRQAKGLTVRQLAKKFGTDPSYITKIELGKTNITITKLELIANALDAKLTISSK